MQEYKDWFDNDELFFEQLNIGLKYQKIVEQRLLDYGIPCKSTTLRIGTTLEERQREFPDVPDLIINNNDKIVLEVKSRKLKFTTKKDYPFDTALLDTVYGWRLKITKPIATLLISQYTEAILVALTSDKSKWKIGKRWDKIRKIPVVSYEVDVSYLVSFDSYCRALYNYLLVNP